VSAAAAAAPSSAAAARQPLEPSSTAWVAGAARIGATARQTRRKTSVPLVPPKPKLFFTATSIFISRAVLAQ